MTCICTFDLKEIRHSGSDIGTDWAYTVTVDGIAFAAKASLHAGGDEGNKIKLKHRWTLEDKPCGTTLEIPISVVAEESDLLFDDRGSKIRMVEVKCPGQGGAPFKRADYELKIDVHERPGFLDGINFVTFVFDIMALCARD